MKFRVKSTEGELEFESFGQLEQAWLLGFVAPNDEVLEEGHEKWRKAGSIPLLVSARRSGEQVWVGKWFAWVLLGVTGATIAIVLLQNGYLLAGIVAAIVVTLVMGKVTMNANRRARPH
jgi:hypothetical protein